MNATANAPSNPWPFARVMILILAGGFFGLMMDIRVEHVDVVRRHTIAWVPIIYSAFMTIACLVAFIRWTKTARRIMLLLFLLALIVGGLGFYLHNDGDIQNVITTSINAWTDPKMKHSKAPPQTAPLSFAGLGVIGILASLKKFNT